MTCTYIYMSVSLFFPFRSFDSTRFDSIRFDSNCFYTFPFFSFFIIHHSPLYYISRYFVFTLLFLTISDDCACHLAVLVVLGGSAHRCNVWSPSGRRNENGGMVRAAGSATSARYCWLVSCQLSLAGTMRRDVAIVCCPFVPRTRSMSSDSRLTIIGGKCVDPPRTNRAPPIRNPLGTNQYIYIHMYIECIYAACHTCSIAYFRVFYWDWRMIEDNFERNCAKYLIPRVLDNVFGNI